MLKIKIPDDVPIVKSEESSLGTIEYVIVSPTSLSLAITVPTEVWFSLTKNVLFETNIGASLTFVILTVILWYVDNTPSLALTVNKYDFLPL